MQAGHRRLYSSFAGACLFAGLPQGRGDRPRQGRQRQQGERAQDRKVREKPLARSPPPRPRRRRKSRSARKAAGPAKPARPRRARAPRVSAAASPPISDRVGVPTSRVQASATSPRPVEAEQHAQQRRQHGERQAGHDPVSEAFGERRQLERPRRQQQQIERAVVVVGGEQPLERQQRGEQARRTTGCRRRCAPAGWSPARCRAGTAPSPRRRRRARPPTSPGRRQTSRRSRASRAVKPLMRPSPRIRAPGCGRRQRRAAHGWRRSAMPPAREVRCRARSRKRRLRRARRARSAARRAARASAADARRGRARRGGAGRPTACGRRAGERRRDRRPPSASSTRVGRRPAQLRRRSPPEVLRDAEIALQAVEMAEPGDLPAPGLAVVGAMSAPCQRMAPARR